MAACAPNAQRRRRLIRALGILPAALMLPPGPVHSQEIRSDVRLGVVALYDDNLLRTNRLRGGFDDAEDTRITPTLSVDLDRRLGGRHRLFLKGDAGYDFYRRNEQLNAERIALEGG